MFAVMKISNGALLFVMQLVKSCMSSS